MMVRGRGCGGRGRERVFQRSTACTMTHATQMNSGKGSKLSSTMPMSRGGNMGHSGERRGRFGFSNS